MKKNILLRTTCFTIIFAIIISMIPTPGFAEKLHNKVFESVFLGKQNKKSMLPSRGKEKIELLEEASYFCIDEYAGTNQPPIIKRFKKFKKNMFPLLIGVEFEQPDGIDFDTDNFRSDTAHRSLTHRGWDYKYSEREINKTHWPVRQKILRLAVNKVFSFTNVIDANSGENSKVESMAELIFCIHVLGDHIEDAEKLEKKIKNGNIKGSDFLRKDYKLEIAGRHDKYDITDKIINCCKVLFKDQKSSFHYKELKRKLDKINSEASKLVYSKDGVYNEKTRLQYENLATEVLKCLEDHLPDLLKEEDYFKESILD